MFVHHKALVLVADGHKFLLLRNRGNFQAPELVVEASGEMDNPPTHEQGTDQPGRRAASRDGVRSAMETTDFHQLEEDRFASDIAGLLEGWTRTGDMEKLIVVAPPHMLAELRRHYSQAVIDCLVAEIDKDLTKHPVKEITRILAE